jgi:Domain of unknown function (DUF1772)
MEGWEIAVTMVLFLCASMYLGTGWSLALFTLPGRQSMTVDNYYDQIVAPIKRATRFFTGMTIVMIGAAIALIVAEWGSAYILAPIAVLAAVVAATLLTTLVLFRYNRRLKERITDEAELREVLERWAFWNWFRLAFWTSQWVALAVYIGLKLR